MAPGGTPTATSDRRVFIGPAWHNLGITPAALGALAHAGRCYLRELSLHHYSVALARNGSVSVGDMLDEARLREAMAKFARLQVRGVAAVWVGDRLLGLRRAAARGVQSPVRVPFLNAVAAVVQSGALEPSPQSNWLTAQTPNAPWLRLPFPSSARRGRGGPSAARQ